MASRTPQALPLAAYARLWALLGAANEGRSPEVVSEESSRVLSEEREFHTGMELRTLVVMSSGQESIRRYIGPSMTGVGLAYLEQERSRLQEVAAATREVQEELDGVIAFLRKNASE